MAIKEETEAIRPVINILNDIRSYVFTNIGPNGAAVERAKR